MKFECQSSHRRVEVHVKNQSILLIEQSHHVKLVRTWFTDGDNIIDFEKLIGLFEIKLGYCFGSLFFGSKECISRNCIVVFDAFAFGKVEPIRTFGTTSFCVTFLTVDFTDVQFPERRLGTRLLYGSRSV